MSNMCYMILKTLMVSFVYQYCKHSFYFRHILNTYYCVREPDAEPGDSGLIIGVVLAILLILICSLVVVFILDKRFKWGLMTRLRSCVPGKHNAYFKDTRAMPLFFAKIGLHHNFKNLT